MNKAAIERKAELVGILVNHASGAFETEDEAKGCARRKSRCGSPFNYKVVACDGEFLVVTGDDVDFYGRLIAFAESLA